MTDDERRALWAAALGVTREELDNHDTSGNPLEKLAMSRRRRRQRPLPNAS